MKRLKQLALVIFTITILTFFFDNLLTILAIVFEKDVLHFGHFESHQPSIFLKSIVIIKFISFSFFIYGASFLIRILLLKDIADYFSYNTSIYLLKSGKFIVLSNIISFFLSFSVFFIDLQYFVYFNTESKYLSLLMIVFGIFLMIFSKVLVSAKKLKQENDLTI